MGIYISLGSNMGDPVQNVRTALEEISGLSGVSITAVSPFYSTEPQLYSQQPWFINAVACLECIATWTPHTLLGALQCIEKKLGRARHAAPRLRYGPRCIDIDLLLFHRQQCNDSTCTLPHPRMLERAFVLVPLHDIAPKVTIKDDVTPETALRLLSYTIQGNKIFQNTCP